MQTSPKRGKLDRGRTALLLPIKRSETVVSFFVCIFLLVSIWIVFGQTTRFEFLNYDDDQYVYENPMIANGLSVRAIWWAFSHAHAQNWHPLTTLSHMLDCVVYGLHPGGHHLTNIILHAAAAILLFVALKKLTVCFWPSAMVAAIFAIHPLRAGSVPWIAERKDVLSGVFFALILWAYARYARSAGSAIGRYLLVLVFFALGLMSKPTLVTVPFLLLLLDWWPLRRFASAPVNPGDSSQRTGKGRSTESIRSLLIEKIPFFLLSAASCVATILAQGRAVVGMQQLSLWDRVANAFVSYVIYLGQLFWPVNLSVVYPYPPGGWSVAQAFLAFVLLSAIALLCLVWRNKYPFLLVGYLWFLGMLVPMIGIIQVGMQARADRYTYLPQIGLYLLLIWTALELFSKYRHGRTIFVAVAFLIISALMADAYFQTSFWQNSETLWTRALATTSNNYIAENNLGDVLMKKEGRLDEAILHLRRSLDLSPEYPDANNNLGYAIATKGEWTEAVPFFRNALRIRPNFPQAHSNLAVSLTNLGKTDEALLELGEAIRLDENYRDAHRNLGVLLLQLGRQDDAVFHFREALRLKPDDPALRDQLRKLGHER